MTQQSRIVGVALVLLALLVTLSACGAVPVAETWPGLTLDGNTLYAISGSPQKVYMLDAETGQPRQSFLPQGEFTPPYYWSPVTVGDGLAFVGFGTLRGDGTALYAFDPETGQQQWSWSDPANSREPNEKLIIAAPAYADGTVYFGDSGGRLFAVDVETKAPKPGWSFQAKSAIWAAPLVVDGRLYVASMDHYVYCLDAESGAEIWKTEVGASIAAQPTLDAGRGVLYVGAYDGRVHVLDAGSGELVDGLDFQAGNWLWSEVVVTGDRLYVSALDGKLYALDPESGAVIPPFPYDATSPLRAAPVLAGDGVVATSRAGTVSSVGIDTALARWQWPSGTPEAEILTTPVISNGVLYVILMNGNVQALDAENGVQKWTFASPVSE